MDGRVQAHAAVVDRVAPEHLIVQVICRSRPVKGFVYGRVARRAIPLAAHQGAGKNVALLCVVNCAALLARRRRGEGRHDVERLTLAAYVLGHRQRLPCQLSLALAAPLGGLAQHVRRNDAKNGMLSAVHRIASVVSAGRVMDSFKSS